MTADSSELDSDLDAAAIVRAHITGNRAELAAILAGCDINATFAGLMDLAAKSVFALAGQDEAKACEFLAAWQRHLIADGGSGAQAG